MLLAKKAAKLFGTRLFSQRNLASFFALALFSSCAVSESFIRKRTESEPMPIEEGYDEGIRWIPAFTIRKNGNDFEIDKELAVGVKVDSIKAPKTYRHPKDIPPEKRVRSRKIVEKAIRRENLSRLDIQNAAVVEMLENNIFITITPPDASGAFQANACTDTYTIDGIEQNFFRGFFRKLCAQYNIMMFDSAYFSSHSQEDLRNVVTHEGLHDGMDTTLAEDERETFVTLMHELFNIGAQLEELDALFLERDDKNRRREVETFVHMGNTPEEEIRSIKEALDWYCEWRAYMTKIWKSGYSEKTRNAFIGAESYPFIVEYELMPAALAPFYNRIITPAGLEDAMHINGKNENLETVEAIRRFIPTIGHFLEQLKVN